MLLTKIQYSAWILVAKESIRLRKGFIFICILLSFRVCLHSLFLFLLLEFIGYKVVCLLFCIRCWKQCNGKASIYFLTGYFMLYCIHRWCFLYPWIGTIIIIRRQYHYLNGYFSLVNFSTIVSSLRLYLFKNNKLPNEFLCSLVSN